VLCQGVLRHCLGFAISYILYVLGIGGKADLAATSRRDQ